MASATDIGWGKYQQWEGPFYLGKCKFDMPVTPSIGEAYRRMSVITATEGGHFDAINMYDRMIISAGIIQWAEAGIFGVSNLLGAVAERYPRALQPVKDICGSMDCEFKKLAGGKWRFAQNNGEVIDTEQEQRELFLLHSSGKQGSWDDESKQHAKEWAAAVATVFEDPISQRMQIEFTADRLMGFVTPDAQKIIFGQYAPSTDEKWKLAAQAAYLSFAANLPAVAAEHLRRFCSGSGIARGQIPNKGTKDWVIGLLKELTFGPNISIYPARYNSIRPVLEHLYGVDLPDFAQELKAWQEQEGIHPDANLLYRLDTVQGVQQALLSLGYDLGPKKADGIYGMKTLQAVLDFQERNKLKVDGVVGPRTRSVLLARLHRS